MNAAPVEIQGLVLYKKRPAIVLETGEKFLIELEDGARIKVRGKDILPLHPGPIRDLRVLMPPSGEVALAWQILIENPVADESKHTLEELAELIYGEFTPSTAWGTWVHLDDGLYFQGVPDEIRPRTPDEVAAERLARDTRQEETRDYEDFLGRIRAGDYLPEKDDRFLRQVEDLALGRADECRVLRELGRAQRREAAHAALLELGYWDAQTNPYPTRLGLPTTSSGIALPALPEWERRDLTHLDAYAIDDPGSQDPDDALSLGHLQIHNGRIVGGNLWVHIADVSALVSPGSPADLEARNRGASLYLPEGMVPMLPPEAVEILGLGINTISPALSFRLELSAAGEIDDLEITPSWVRVERLTYEQAEKRLDQEPFQGLHQLARLFQDRRRKNGALFIDLPEVKIRVVEGEVEIVPLLNFNSRELVQEAMLMTGEGAAIFATRHQIPFPFVLQDDFDGGLSGAEGLSPVNWEGLAGNYALRRGMARSLARAHPGRHAGIGLPLYSRATSPLRRYMDLVVHQQLRAYLNGAQLLTQGEILERIGVAEAVTSSVSQAESLSRRHWTLVYLLQHPGWFGEGVLVETSGVRSKIIIPELAFETWVQLGKELPLNSLLRLELTGVNLPELEAYFKASEVLKPS